MASELKGQTLVDALCKGEAYLDNDLKPHWGTRPVPTATDTVSKDGTDGLVRYAHDNGTLSGLSRNEHGPWCLHSQAAELLAAERAEKEKLEDAWLEAEGKISDLKSSNAALTARVKELEDGRQRSIKQYEIDMLQQLELRKSLEAKLAAAEKALETEKALADRLASALEYIDDYSLSYPDLGTVTAVAQPALEAHSAARAVLGGKPS